MNVIHVLCDTLRRDHRGPYHQGRPLNEVYSAEQPDRVVPTPLSGQPLSRARRDRGST